MKPFVAIVAIIAGTVILSDDAGACYRWKIWNYPFRQTCATAAMVMKRTPSAMERTVGEASRVEARRPPPISTPPEAAWLPPPTEDQQRDAAIEQLEKLMKKEPAK